MHDDTKHALAELIGTFTLVFIGAGAGALSQNDDAGRIAVALAHGLALSVIVYAFGPISGAHVNPAVTFALALTGHVGWLKVIRYWAAQLLGAAAAAVLLLNLLPSPGSLGATTGSLTDADPARTIVIEAVLTFFLVTAVFGSAVSGRNGNAYGLAIGLVLAMDILAAGPLTGASMNPARTFGPCLALKDYHYLHLYIIGPLIGGAAAGVLYHTFFLRDKE